MNIKQVQRILMTNFLFMLLVALLLVVLYETEILTANDIAANQTMMFGILVVMELTTILVIPMALKLFSLKAIAANCWRKRAMLCFFWGTTRINMLCPAYAHQYLYVLSDHVACIRLYMAIILVLCLFFVYPSIGRCIEETSEEGE